ncbi:MAG: ComEC/Rec2 family competence protein [Micrococcaceae bacterium]|nr:ComEC/Rec2 family competence protein [Micrococcaceae bacterium]
MLSRDGAGFLQRLLSRWARPDAGTASGPVDDGYLDLRSLAAAAGAWAAAWELVRHDPALARILTVALGLLLVFLFGVLMRNRGLLAWSRHWWTPVAAAAVGVFLVSAAISTHSLAQMDPTFAALAATSSTLRVEAVVTGDPRRIETGGAAHTGEPIVGQHAAEERPEPTARLMVDVRILKYSAHGNWHAGAAEAVLVLDAGRAGPGAEPLPGRIVSGLARLSPAEPGERQGYWLRAVASMQTRDTPSPEPVSEQWRRRFVLESAVLPGTGPALLPGMVMGDRSAQGPELDSAMKTAGLAHLTAVSGANVAMILGSVLWLCRFCGVNRWLALGASLVTLVGFVILVHPEPSVIRAAVMGAVGAVAVYLGRGRQALTALCVCVCGVLAWDPWFAREPAFQLSVLATAGIVLMGARLGALARRIMPGWLADGVAISTSAQLFCLPVLLGMNPAFSLYAVPANVLAAPLVPLVTVAGMSALLLCAVPGPWAQPLIWLAGIPADWIGMLGRLVHGLPGALLPWPEGSGGRGAAVLLALMALVAVWLASTPAAEAGPHPGRWAWLRPFAGGRWASRTGPAPGTGRRTVAGAAALGCLGLLAGLTLPATAWWPDPPGLWQVAGCDVGQGDSFVLRSAPDHAVVIDTGLDPDVVDDCLDELGVHTIDALFITHLHADHAGGVEGAVRGRTVEQAFYSTGTDSTELPGLPQGLEATVPEVGQTGSAGPVSWEVIGPIGDPRGEEENDASLVVVFRMAAPGHPPFTLLATGDLEEQAMDAVLRAHPELQVDVLKVSHHGAKNGGTAVIDQSGARVALIGVGGGNSYGHPTPKILKALHEAGMHTFRTDLNGTIRLRVTPTGELVITGRPVRPSGR